MTERKTTREEIDEIKRWLAIMGNADRVSLNMHAKHQSRIPNSKDALKGVYDSYKRRAYLHGPRPTGK